MDYILKILGQRLVDKGIVPDTIPAYIRDLFNTTSMNGNPGLFELNRGMERLGWNELDDHTFQLITAAFESSCEYKKAGEDLFGLKRVQAK